MSFDIAYLTEVYYLKNIKEFSENFRKNKIFLEKFYNSDSFKSDSDSR